MTQLRAASHHLRLINDGRGLLRKPSGAEVARPAEGLPASPDTAWCLPTSPMETAPGRSGSCGGGVVLGVLGSAEARWPGHTHLEKFLGKATWTWAESIPLKTTSIWAEPPITFENTKGKKGNWPDTHLTG